MFLKKSLFCSPTSYSKTEKELTIRLIPLAVVRNSTG